jgi:hypothetical protein
LPWWAACVDAQTEIRGETKRSARGSRFLAKSSCDIRTRLSNDYRFWRAVVGSSGCWTASLALCPRGHLR